MANQVTMERELLSCSICLDLLIDPKTLPCMHRFCESCLSGHIFASAERTSDSRPGFSCPECREFIPAPDSSSTPSTWAGMFKTDFTIKSMVEVYESKQDVLSPKVRNPCPKHEDKDQELYCFDCAATVCHLCAVISHRTCRQILTVKGAAQQRRAIWREYQKQTQVLITKALEAEELKAGNMNEIYIKKYRAEKQIKEAAKKIHQIVADEKEKLLKQIQGNYDNLQQKALTFNDLIEKLKSCESDVSSKLSSSSDFDLMVEKDVLKTVQLCSLQNLVFSEVYRCFCEALSSVTWIFRQCNISRVNLGSLEYISDTAGCEQDIWAILRNRTETDIQSDRNWYRLYRTWYTLMAADKND